jgi:hypothetical protein
METMRSLGALQAGIRSIRFIDSGEAVDGQDTTFRD